jgi:hypothetical protein
MFAGFTRGGSIYGVGGELKDEGARCRRRRGEEISPSPLEEAYTDGVMPRPQKIFVSTSQNCMWQ